MRSTINDQLINNKMVGSKERIFLKNIYIYSKKISIYICIANLWSGIVRSLSLDLKAESAFSSGLRPHLLVRTFIIIIIIKLRKPQITIVQKQLLNKTSIKLARTRGLYDFLVSRTLTITTETGKKQKRLDLFS